MLLPFSSNKPAEGNGGGGGAGVGLCSSDALQGFGHGSGMLLPTQQYLTQLQDNKGSDKLSANRYAYT